MEWIYGENSDQKYYEADSDGTSLVVFANNYAPNMWLGMVGNRMIHDKTRNDRQRKKQSLQKGCPLHLLQGIALLTSADPEYMMKKVEHCFKTGKIEVSQ